MSQPINDLILFTLFALGLVTFAAARSLSMLVAINAVSLICGPLLGQPSLMLFGHITDVGSVFFAVTIYGVCLQYVAYGSQAAYRSTGPITTALVLVFGAIFFLQEANLLGLGITANTQVAGARIIVFCLLHPLFVYLLQRRSHWPRLVRLPAITILMTTVDGFIFFPLAFYRSMPIAWIVDFTAVCIGVRAMVIVTAIPFLAVFLWLQARGSVTHPGRFRAFAGTTYRA